MTKKVPIIYKSLEGRILLISHKDRAIEISTLKKKSQDVMRLNILDESTPMKIILNRAQKVKMDIIILEDIIDTFTTHNQIMNRMLLFSDVHEWATMGRKRSKILIPMSDYTKLKNELEYAFHGLKKREEKDYIIFE